MKKILLILIIISNYVFASNNNILLIEINKNFAKTWDILEKEIIERKHTVAYKQRCDYALTERNYDTDKYRIIFFGKYSEIKELAKNYPKIIPYLPLKITAVAYGNKTLLTAKKPVELLEIVKDEKHKKIIQSWNKDLEAIITKVQE